MVSTLAEDDIGADEVPAGSELDVAALAAPDTRVSYQQQIAVFRNALRLSPDPAVGLHAGERMHVTAYGMWGYALLSSRGATDVLELAINARSVIGPLADMSYETGPRKQTMRFDVLLTDDPRDALYRFAIELTCAAHLTLGRDMYGESFGPIALRLAYQAPPHADTYRQVFGCPVRFGCAHNEFDIDAGWAQQAPRMREPATHEMARQACEHLLKELDSSGGMRASVQRTLIKMMPWRFPTIDAMASELQLHPRTLRRRLRAEDTTYRDILAQVRQQLATEYLRQTSLTTEEIATRLGYSEATNFRHAFVRWTGKSPREFRGS